MVSAGLDHDLAQAWDVLRMHKEGILDRGDDTCEDLEAELCSSEGQTEA